MAKTFRLLCFTFAFLVLEADLLAQDEQAADDGCTSPCVEIGLVDRLWEETADFSMALMQAFATSADIDYRLTVHPTRRAQTMMKRGEFDVFLYNEGKPLPGTIVTQNSVFDVYAVAVGLKTNAKLAGMPQSAEGLTVGSIRGDDIYKWLPDFRGRIQTETLTQALSMLDRNRVDLVTEFGVKTEAGLAIPHYDPSRHRIYELSGPLHVKLLFPDNARGNELRQAFDNWIWRAHQSASLFPFYEKAGLESTYPGSFVAPEAAQ